VIDGASYSVRLVHDGLRVRSVGENAYPPAGTGPDITPTFRRFLTAVSRLAGGRPIP
jgi:hypothetical protein